MSGLLKPSKVFLFLFLSILFCSQTLISQELYWVNGTGSWNDPAHWSETSGGPGGAGIPGPSDDVFFDDQSFTGSGQKVKIKGEAVCHDLIWTVQSQPATLKSRSFIFNAWTWAELSVHGSLIMEGQMNNDFYGDIRLEEGSSQRSIKLNQAFHSDFVIDGGEATVELQSDLETGGDIRIASGAFIAKGKDISCDAFIGKGSQPRTLDLEESEVQVEQWDFSETRNMEFPSSNFSLLMKSGMSNSHFKSSDGIEYDDVSTASLKSSFSFTTSINEATCFDSNDGSIEVTVSGGTLPFDYELYEGSTTDNQLRETVDKNSRTHTYSNLSGGTYLVRIVDGDGTSRARTEVVGPEQLRIDTVRNLKALSCFDSQDAWFEVVASGGSRPYSYSWKWKRNFGDPWTNLGTDSIEKNLGRGFIQVSVNDGNGCGPVSQDIYFETDGQYSDSIPPKINVDGVSSTDACETEDDGTVSINASGGTGDLDFYLVAESTLDTIPASGFDEDGDFTGLAADTYQAWVVDANGCRKQGNDAVVGSIPATSITSQPSSATVCEGNTPTFLVSAEGGGNLTYQWQSDVSGSWQDLTDGGNISGANSDALSISGTTNADEGNYRVVVSSDCGADQISAAVSLTVNDATQITSQPSDQTVCQGTDATFSLNADGTNLSYQWQSNAGGSWQDLSDGGEISGTTTNTLTISNAEDADEADYRCEITGDCGDETSNVVTLTVNLNTAITSQPSNQTLCEGNDAIFSVSAEGTNLTYQWESDESGSWQALADGGDISGATTDQLTISNTTNADEANYRVVVSGDCGADQTSASVSLTVNDATQITSQPSSQTVCEGTNTTFSLSADGTNLSYQWQTNAGGSWQDLSDGGDISGATTTSLTLSNTDETDEADYRCLVSGDCGDQTSDVVSLTVNPNTQITGQPTDQTVCEGVDAVFSVAADGTNLSYQWQSDASGSWQDLSDGGDISGSSTDQLTISNTLTADEAGYRVVVSGDCGADQTSNAVSLTVNDATQITSQPTSQTACEGTDATFTLSASGTNLSYQWQSNASGTWQDLSDGGEISGATTNSLTLSNTDETDVADYRCLVSGDCGDQTSDVVSLTVNPSTQIISQPADQTVCEGVDAIFSVGADGTNLSYQWQSDASGSWQDLSDGGDISGSATDQLTLSNASNADEAGLRVVVTGDCGPDQTSGEVTLTVNDTTDIISQPADQTVCEGNDAVFSVSAGGTNLSYQWQSDAGGSWQDLSDGGDISGATTNSLTISNTQQDDEAAYRVVATGDCGAKTSNPAGLTVDPATRLIGQPSDQQVCEQEEVVFGVEAEGSGALTYQWQSNKGGTWQNLADGDGITGSATDSVVLAQVDTTDEGDYRVIVSGTCGADTSMPANLDVNWFEINIGQPSPFSIDTNTTRITVAIEVANHEWAQDLGYYLVSPSGDKIRLGSPSGGCFINQQSTNLTFTTSQTDTFDVCSDNLSGTYGISGFLTPLQGTDPANGAWKIRVEDSQNWTSNDFVGEVISTSIIFTDQHDVQGDTVTISYEASGVNIPIREYSGLSGAEPAFTEYNVPTGLKTSCYGTCDAIAVVSHQGGIGPYNYEWSDSSDFANIIDNGDTTSLCAGKYYVRVTDGLGCTEIDSVVVQEPEEIVIDSLEVLSIIDKNGCYGSSIGEVHDSAYGGTGVLQYTLLRDPFGVIDTIGVNTSGDFTGLPGGEYLLEVRDNNNCVSDTVFTLAQPDSIGIISEQFTPLSAEGAADGSIEVDAQGGTPPLSYVLYQVQPTDTLAVDTTSNGYFTGLAEGNYFVQVTDINGCGPVESSDFIISDLEIDFTLDPVTCADDSNGRVIANIQGGLPPLRYEWTSLAGDTLRVAEKSLPTDTLAGLAGGRYILNLIDSTGNSERDTALVSEPEPLRVSNIVPDTLSGAAASDASITVEAVGGNDTIIFDMVNLNVPSFSAADTALSVNDTATVQFSGLEAGLYEVSVYDEKGCGYDVDTTHVIHFELSLSKEDIPCHGDANGLVVADISGGTLPLEYDWGVSVSSTNQRSDSLANRQPGWYYVRVTDANGFALTDSAEIMEPAAIHAPAIISQAQCPSDHMPLQGGQIGSVRLNASGGAPYSDPDAAYHYYWEELGDTIPGRDTLTGIGGGEYQVSVIDRNGCSLDTTITLSQVPQNVIDVQYGGVVDSVCYGEPVSIFVSNVQNADSLYWEDTGDQYVSEQQLDTLRQVQETDRTYTLRAKNDACILVDSIAVALYPRLNLAINEGDEVSDNQISVKENVSVRQITATVQNTSLQATYMWAPERFFNPSDQLETELSVESMRQEELARQKISIVGETQHCTELDTAVVQLIPNVEPSNAFSPNGDGINDEWYIRYAGQYEDIEVVVFNRWGVEIYRQKPYRNDEGWDGRTSQGKQLPSGTYYYIIDTHESGITPLSGNITIIR